MLQTFNRILAIAGFRQTFLTLVLIDAFQGAPLFKEYVNLCTHSFEKTFFTRVCQHVTRSKLKITSISRVRV